jgi:hypothetical protein
MLPILAEPLTLGAMGLGIGLLVAAPSIRLPFSQPREVVVRDAQLVNDETPAGKVDGANRMFLLEHEPRRGTLCLYVDRARQVVGKDYLYAGRTITFAADNVPQIGASIVAEYAR